MLKKSVDQLLSDLAISTSNNDWQTVQKLSQEILTQDPSNDKAVGFLKVARQMLQGSIDADGAAYARDKAAVASTHAGSLPEDVFVGRDKEMTRLKTIVEESCAGRGRIIMLVGEPGIGKSRTAEEVHAYAESLGAVVLWGRCYEHQGAPPYWPWVQVIRSYLESCDADQLREEMGPGAGVIAEIIPDVRGKLGNISRPVALDDPGHSRFRFLDATTKFLKRVSIDNPLVVILDDLHWADTPTLVFLEFMAREIAESKLLVVGTCRSAGLGHRRNFQKTLGDLTKERQFERVQLRGLDLADVQRFIELNAGTTISSSLADAVHAHTEGNPLFVTEVVRLMAEQGELRDDFRTKHKPWSLKIPDGVKEAIGRRLDRLSSECIEVLTVAAVIGKNFRLEILSGFFESKTEYELAQLIEEGLGSRMIEEQPGFAGHYRFAHSLIQQTLKEELTTTRRVQLHAKIAQLLEGFYGSEAEEHSAELAMHFAEAETVLGAEKLARYSLMAGKQAQSKYAHEEAAGHFERGLAAKQGMPIDDETANLEYGLGVAFWGGGRTNEHFIHLRRAFEYFEKVGNTEKVVSIVSVRGFISSGSISEALVDKALELVPADSVEACRLMWQVARHISFKGNVGYRQADGIYKKALRMARQHKDIGLELQITTWQSQGELDKINEKGILEKAYAAIELARSADGPASEAWAHYRCSYTLGDQGNYEEAARHAEMALRIIEKVNYYVYLHNIILQSLNLRTFKGEWEAARKYSDRGLELGIIKTVSRSVDHLCMVNMCMRSCIELETGNTEQGADLLKRYVEIIGRLDPARTREKSAAACRVPVIARVIDLPVGLDVAEAAAQSVLSNSRISLFDSACARIGLGLIAVQRGDEEAAGEQYEALLKLPLLWAHGPLGEPRKLLGLMAFAAGKTNQAMTHFEDSLRFCREADYPNELAWTCFEYAGALLGRHHPGDRSRARKLSKEGLPIAEKLGIVPLKKRLVGMMKRLESADENTPDYPDGLSGREVEVLGLVAKGFTNQDIGELLHISIKTVATHIRHILKKTGCANRTEASVYGIRKGLVGE